MKQYQDLLREIISTGVEKESGRANMPNVIGISGSEMRFNLQNGYPLLTTKQMFWKGIIHELLWIMRGETNIKYLVDNGVNIWNGDAYRWYLRYCDGMNISEDERFSMEEFIETIKTDQLDRFSRSSIGIPDYLKGSVSLIYRLGDLGKVYGHQWRKQNGVDQLRDLIEGLKNNPYSRYHIIDAWNKSDFVDMALPPCHLLYQFIVRPLNKNDKVEWLNTNALMYDQKPWTIDAFCEPASENLISKQNDIPKFFLDLSMYQRSCDTFLGVPFNIASMSTLLMIIAKTVGMVPGIARWIGGDVHLYTAHLTAASEQIQRQPYDLPRLLIQRNLKTIEDIESLTINDFNVIGYHYHPKIKQELFTGYKR